MTKEQLLALGLSEEQADKIVEGYGKMVPKSRLDDKIAELKTATETIVERDNQLEELKPKAAGNEALQAEITKLQNENKTAAETHASELAETRRTFAIESALKDAKVHNVKATKALLDLDKITLNDDQALEGLAEQLEGLKQSDAYLFVPEGLKGSTPPAGAPPKPQTLTRADFAKKPYEERMKLMEENPSILKELQ